MKTIIKTYKLFIHNNHNYIVYLSSNKIFILNFALTSFALGLLHAKEILKKYLLFSIHKLILIKLDKIEKKKSNSQ